MFEYPVFTELDLLAVGFIDGEFDMSEFQSLDDVDKFLVISLSGLYACAKIGLCSGKKIAGAKYKLLNFYKQIRLDLHWTRSAHHQWVERTRKTSGKLCELAKAINKKETKALPLALEIIDLLSQDDVYSKMLMMQEQNENFSKECVQQLVKMQEFYFERFGEVPLGVILVNFFSRAKEERIDEEFKQLEWNENTKKLAMRVPIKSDNVSGIYKSYKKLLEIKD